MHDGLQADGHIELRLDWKAPGKKAGDDWIAQVALIRVNPWLAYGCGEGARLAIRKPGATESTASTLQRALRYGVAPFNKEYDPTIFIDMQYMVLGDGVNQKGSLVDEQKARFDFSHGAAMSADECERVEALVRGMVSQELPVQIPKTMLA